MYNLKVQQTKNGHKGLESAKSKKSKEKSGGFQSISATIHIGRVRQCLLFADLKKYVLNTPVYFINQINYYCLTERAQHFI